MWFQMATKDRRKCRDGTFPRALFAPISKLQDAKGCVTVKSSRAFAGAVCSSESAELLKSRRISCVPACKISNTALTGPTDSFTTLTGSPRASSQQFRFPANSDYIERLVSFDEGQQDGVHENI
jgi:hypothetical protein